MSMNSDASNVSRRQFLAAAGSVAAASSFALGKDSGSAQSPPPPPVVYKVTIDVTKAPISYSMTDPNGVVHNAYRLRAETGDKVTWTVKPSKTQYHVSILFLKETPLNDTNGNPTYTVLGSDQTTIPPMVIDKDASGTYEYYVGVVDDYTKQTYSDDPKIIVGTGNFEARATITSALDELRKTAEDVERKREHELEKQIESVEKKLERAIDELM